MKMGRTTGMLLGVLVAIVLLAALVFWLSPLRHRVTTARLTGVVLAHDPDPAKQVPLADAEIRATTGGKLITAKSDDTGYFQLTLPRSLSNGSESLEIRQPLYAPFQLDRIDTNQLLLARLQAIHPHAAKEEVTPLSISHVRIRYNIKAENTSNIGSIVRTFKVLNAADHPCAPGAPCSPDNKWKATVTRVAYDAGENNRFINTRLSCVAGPCAFTRVTGSNIAEPVRKLEIAVLNWSDPATYLVEAEVSRTMLSDMVREAFPATFGSDMDFTLPATAEGPSIQAELNGTSIVFPLGPNLLLSWATCTSEPAPQHTRLFRCELKPGFAFR